MAAARWTAHATDITGTPAKWDDYLSVQQLSNQIGLAETTIMDTLTRRLSDPTDPRTAILFPAVRIGPTRLSAIPRWTQGQADEYTRLAEERTMSGRAAARRELPVYTPQQAAKAGLASTAELAEEFERAENTLRWWIRAYQRDTADRKAFPPEVGIAQRDPAYPFGPPLGLRRTRDVGAWIEKYARERTTSATA